MFIGGCAARVYNRSWVSAVEYMVSFCSSFPPCKIQCLGSDAKKLDFDFKGLKQAVCHGIDTTGGRKVHRRWDGFDELNDCSKFADFTADFCYVNRRPLEMLSSISKVV